ncbi:hypothetical protein TNIN_121511 [Trichonephila inaurata madagascariensis]|uniref:Uncharacterized protein n=1 Tax=Trichonephila inaurata madagascariensis TaxID=2747483 RepID=A0A8X6XVG7_9ARAC|nr:hypothetical protein TNIN_121511 [Trichonephila inaurata madagascariensis]
MNFYLKGKSHAEGIYSSVGPITLHRWKEERTKETSDAPLGNLTSRQSDQGPEDFLIRWQMEVRCEAVREVVDSLEFALRDDW